MRHLSVALTIFLLLASGSGGAGAEFQQLTQWRAYGGGEIPSNWQVSGGDISHTPGGGDLVSVETFRNFELAFDWRIASGGNSGIMYRVVESAGAAHASGPEYQILDNPGHPDGQSPLTSAASAYGLYPPQDDVTLPAGEWNSGRSRNASSGFSRRRSSMTPRTWSAIVARIGTMPGQAALVISTNSASFRRALPESIDSAASRMPS